MHETTADILHPVNDDMRESNTTDDPISHIVSTSDPETLAASIMASVTNETSTTFFVKLSEPSKDNQRLWNLSMTATTSEPPEELASSLLSTYDTSRTTATYTTIPTTTLDPFDEFGPPEGVEYIFVPLGVVVSVIILSAVVLIISRKRKLERLRHRLMPMYNFDPGEEEEDDWETELLDECYSTHQRRQGYQSMDTEENAELFGGH